jgi:holo-[acyl-carrier protein] synthase
LIQSIGLDIVATERIASALARYGDRFLQRILGPRELLLLQKRPDPAMFTAGRFAAKEAVIKALADILDRRPPWRSIEVVSSAGGKPVVQFSDSLKEKLSGYACLISISHDKNVTAAVAVISERP